jgi:NAD(P)-dependent dehydrogenase (short-subunit alcohol dehydrogenase family)
VTEATVPLSSPCPSSSPTRRHDDLSGRTAIVTGGGRGIGAAIARALARRGARVLVDGRQETALRQLAEEITAGGGEVLAVAGSVTDPAHLDELVGRAVAGGRSLDILVNNAGIARPTAALVDLALEEWNETLAVNLTGVFLACKVAIPHLARTGHGRIVNIGSGTGKRPLANRSPYAAAKLGLVGLTRTLAVEVGRLGITVNVVSPFLVDNERLQRVITSMSAAGRITPHELREELESGSALGRAVTEEEVAAAVGFLCSDAAAAVTGQDLNVSAGAVMY